MIEPNPNRTAFLTMIAVSEGTAGKGDDGYNVLVGGGRFNSYADHPRQLVHLNAHLESTAAGRYQILARTFDAYKTIAGVTDFSPPSQDQIALVLIRERGAILPIDRGNVDDAIARIKTLWASLPGAGYGQHENSLIALRQAFTSAGGALAV